MRSIFAAIIMLSAVTAGVHSAEVKEHVPTRPGYGNMQAPVGHRQPTQDDATGANQV